MDKPPVNEKSSWRNDLGVRVRQAGADWILAHERQLEAIVKQLQAATMIWKAGDASEESGRSTKQFAVVKIGQTLITGRNAYSSDKKFGDWLKTLKLESPFDDRRERYAAIRIAQLFSDEIRLVTAGINDEDHRTIDEMNLVKEKLKLCPHTRPNDIRTWAHKTGLIPRKARSPDATPKARAKIRVAVENGQSVNRGEISQETGLSDGAVGRAHAMEQARLEGIAEGEALALNEQGKFTKAQAKHVETLVKKLKRDLNAQFTAAVEKQVNKLVEMRKAALDQAREAVKKQLNDAFKDQQHWKALINNHKPFLTEAEDGVILKCIHPNGFKQITEERMRDAFIIYNRIRTQLTGKQ